MISELSLNLKIVICMQYLNSPGIFMFQVGVVNDVTTMPRRHSE